MSHRPKKRVVWRLGPPGGSVCLVTNEGMPRRTRGPAATCFTLVELIMALILMSIMGALMLPVFQTSLLHGGSLLTRVEDASALVIVFEKISDEYETTYSGALTTLQTRINASPQIYGNYIVETNEFITFDENGVEQNEATLTDTLKVTLADTHGQRLTMLYPHRPSD